MELMNSLTTSEHKKLYKKYITRGNLKYMFQRIDIGLLEGDNEYPPRIYLKIGKTGTQNGEFTNKEQAQGYFITTPEHCEELIGCLIAFKNLLRKKTGHYNLEFHMYEDVKKTVEIHRHPISIEG